MSTKKLTIGNDTFEYPINGTGNYGEEATAWANAVTVALQEVKGPGDISTTETTLVGVDNGDGTSTGIVSGLLFDVSFVQAIEINGLITRTFTDTSIDVEYVSIKGGYDGVEFYFTEEYNGEDTEVEFSFDGGQVKFTSVNDANTVSRTFKFTAKAIVDSSVI